MYVCLYVRKYVYKYVCLSVCQADFTLMFCAYCGYVSLSVCLSVCLSGWLHSSNVLCVSWTCVGCWSTHWSRLWCQRIRLGMLSCHFRCLIAQYWWITFRHYVFVVDWSLHCWNVWKLFYVSISLTVPPPTTEASEALCSAVIHLAVRLVCQVPRYLCTSWSDFFETWHKYSSRDWALLKRFSGSEVKGQGRIN